ncbi:glycerol-3-phosphate dehydrogenase [Mycobacterium malmoense]|uniref:Glycerol-3-phosphate dehydrogenase [NAD(P)+] n=1 Tax=Mycobacterium malmoense TaxID=1780 RepID=A0A1B9DCV0_MYCMA|nr:NAD(P)H-dependent glycerol-3-phosphate dehydrogenase [Mycobacterium malmoense]OCB25505.1 glycerol-3-phosphate dehydrogenase [Mycobacterium malmoense]OCB37725.1 glycerol-3-phosphate dehydrogenase [Mycobacterium malmoense]OCB38661.1 glycerol-3-phosphate dehydrogenase [Mycobacterium malmoense]OCB60724.1 glycerol-3-phosphate dehydrogenase [Mycobacterium malmoense]
MASAPASSTGAVAVMGAGAWGTALAKVLVEAGEAAVTLWARRADVADRINATRANPDYLPGTVLPAGVRATTDAAEALGGASTVLLAVPAQTMRANLEGWAPLLPGGATLVSLAKGIELGTLMRMSQVIVSVTGVDPAQVAVISGPNLASEIAECQPAATVVACSDSGRAVALQRMLNTGYFRPYTNSDVVGTEIGGACKNVIALACGMAAGVGLGENTAAAIITRGLAEIMRLGIALGAKGATLAGLAGVGDLVATCTSPYSRNRSFGERLGRGGTMESALQARDGHVVEGVTSCESVLALASSYDVEMPLTDAVHRVCHKGLSVDEAMALLLGRRTKPE